MTQRAGSSDRVNSGQVLNRAEFMVGVLNGREGNAGMGERRVEGRCVDVAERVDCHFDGVVSGSKGGSAHDGIPLDRAHDDVVPSPPSLRNGGNQALETGHGRRREVDVRWRGPKSVGECLPRAIE